MRKYVIIQQSADDRGVHQLEDEVNTAVAQGYKMAAAYGLSMNIQAVNVVWMVKEDAK